MSPRCGPARACADCRKIKPIQARLLCEPCYRRHFRAGTLESHPLSPMTRRGRACAEVAELVADLLDLGEYGRQAVARRLGVQPGSVYRALQRAGRVDLWDRLV